MKAHICENQWSITSKEVDIHDEMVTCGMDSLEAELFEVGREDALAGNAKLTCAETIAMLQEEGHQRMIAEYMYTHYAKGWESGHAKVAVSIRKEK